MNGVMGTTHRLLGEPRLDRMRIWIEAIPEDGENELGSKDCTCGHYRILRLIKGNGLVG